MACAAFAIAVEMEPPVRQTMQGTTTEFVHRFHRCVHGDMLRCRSCCDASQKHLSTRPPCVVLRGHLRQDGSCWMWLEQPLCGASLSEQMVRGLLVELRGNRQEYLQWQWDARSVAALLHWKPITPDFDLLVRVFQIDFQHLVQQIVVTVQFIQGNFKKLKL